VEPTVPTGYPFLPRWEERLTDLWIHYSLTLLEIPLLFLCGRTPRLAEFPA
jgi:hypothetical protein